MRKFLLLFLIFALLLSGCSLLNDAESEAEATQTPEIWTPQPSPSPPATPQAIEPDPAGPTVLNIWVVGETSLEDDSPAGIILTEQLASFQNNNPDIELNVEVKASTGQGSALSYLRSGRDVAPAILPDMIVLSADQIETAAAEQLIYALDNLVVIGAYADLFPAAYSHSQVGDQAYAYPFTLSNLSHMAYSTSVFTQTLPLTWDELMVAEETTFTFPGSGTPGAELVLSLYLASGGKLANESGQPILEVEPLANALTLLERGREEGLLPIQTTNMTVLAESWQAFNNGIADSVQTDYGQYSIERESGLDSNYTGIPGVEAPLTPMVKAWTWVISTPDPGRQLLVADLLNWLIAAPNMGDWSLAAGELPARRTAFESWPADDGYNLFIQQQLEVANPYPYNANGAILSAVSIASFDVLSLTKTPHQAAQDAVTSLSP